VDSFFSPSNLVWLIPSIRGLKRMGGYFDLLRTERPSNRLVKEDWEGIKEDWLIPSDRTGPHICIFANP